MKKLVTLSAVAIMAALSLMPSAEAQNYGYEYGLHNKHSQNYNNRYGNNYGNRYGNNYGNRYGHNYNNGANIDAVQSQLQARINAGIANGRINQQEAARLQGRMSRIANLEAQLRSSGRGLSFSERNRLNNELSKLNSQITREMNDFDRRQIGFWGNGRWR